VVRESPSTLDAYARVPIAFHANRVLRVSPAANGGGFTLEEGEHPAGVKDYDELPNEGPESWPHRFDVSTWGLLAAFMGDARVGGAAVVTRDASVDMLEGRDDLALLWDIRVAPHVRQRSVGSALMREAEAFAIAEGCRTLKVETQDINVPACRFYMRHGFELRAAIPGAYSMFPEETMLLWYKELA
jgi:ribosomal protein S18 acetylase RimI-like enzyme